MSHYSKHQIEYIDSVDGQAHQSAVRIIGELSQHIKSLESHNTNQFKKLTSQDHTVVELIRAQYKLKAKVDELTKELAPLKNCNTVFKITTRRDFRKVQAALLNMSRLYTEDAPVAVVINPIGLQEAIEAAKEVDWALMLPHEQKKFEPIRFEREQG